MTGHTLLEPRVIAAVGLLGLGASLGIGLLLASKFPLVGLLLSLASVAGVIWIYWSRFYEVYRALLRKRAYTGPLDIKEIVVIFPVLIVVVTLSSSLYFSPPSTDNPSVRSRLEFRNVTPQTHPNSSTTYFNVQLDNVGSLTAKKAITRTNGLLSTHVLSADEERAEMNKLIDLINRVLKNNRQGEIQPSQGAVISLPDLTHNTDTLNVTDDDLSNINDGKMFLYVFAVAEYEDEDRKAEDWRFEYCGFFFLTYSYWHNCAWQSRVYRLPHS